MKNIALVLTLLMLSGCAVLASPNDWTRTDTVAEIAWQTMNVVDYGQTKDIQRHPNLVEVNWLSRRVLGPNPGTRETFQLLLTYALGHYLVSKYLPVKWRPYWHGSSLAGKYITIKSNHALGLRIDGHGHGRE